MPDNKAIPQFDFERMFFASDKWEEFSKRLASIAYDKLAIIEPQNAEALILHTSLRLIDDTAETPKQEILHFHFLLDKPISSPASDDENGVNEPAFP